MRRSTKILAYQVLRKRVGNRAVERISQRIGSSIPVDDEVVPTAVVEIAGQQLLRARDRHFIVAVLEELRKILLQLKRIV